MTLHIRECSCPRCKEFDEIEERFTEWLCILEKDVIEAEFGYEPGEFTVYPSHWRSSFDEGLTPIAAWHRALVSPAERETP